MSRVTYFTTWWTDVTPMQLSFLKTSLQPIDVILCWHHWNKSNSKERLWRPAQNLNQPYLRQKCTTEIGCLSCLNIASAKSPLYALTRKAAYVNLQCAMRCTLQLHLLRKLRQFPWKRQLWHWLSTISSRVVEYRLKIYNTYILLMSIYNFKAFSDFALETGDIFSC